MSNDNNQILAALQESMQRERKQMKTLITTILVILAVVVFAFLAVGVLWIKALSGQNVNVQNVVLAQPEETPSVAVSAPVEESVPAVVSPPVAQSVKNEPPKETTVKATEPDKSLKTVVKNVEPVEQDPRTLIRRHPANEIVTLALPTQVENPATIPGYQGSRLMLVTDRGIAIPWFIVVPEN